VTRDPQAGPVQPGKSLEVVRERRHDMLEVLVELEGALAHPAGIEPSLWIGNAEKVMLRLRDEFDVHIDVTESPGGLFEECIDASPRVASGVAVLTREHQGLTEQIGNALAALASREGDVERIVALRAQLTDLLGKLTRHRQKGADLVWDAYNVDIGGE